MSTPACNSFKASCDRFTPVHSSFTALCSRSIPALSTVVASQPHEAGQHQHTVTSHDQVAGQHQAHSSFTTSCSRSTPAHSNFTASGSRPTPAHSSFTASSTFFCLPFFALHPKSLNAWKRIPSYPCFSYFPAQIIFRSWKAFFRIFYFVLNWKPSSTVYQVYFISKLKSVIFSWKRS